MEKCEPTEKKKTKGQSTHRDKHVLSFDVSVDADIFCCDSREMGLRTAFPCMLRGLSRLISEYLYKDAFIWNGPPAFRWNKYRFSLLLPAADARYWKRLTHYFVHIPKTAGISILDAKRPSDVRLAAPGHVFASEIPKAFINSEARMKLFTFVRNPYDRAVSIYHHMKEASHNAHARYACILREYPTFEQWVLGGLLQVDRVAHVGSKPNDSYRYWREQTIRPYSVMHYEIERPWMDIWCAQVLWLLPRTASQDLVITQSFLVPNDRIGRYETLQKDVQRLLGVDPADFPHSNYTDHAPWPSYYTNPRVRDAIYNLYRLDFELLGYNKEI